MPHWPHLRVERECAGGGGEDVWVLGQGLGDVGPHQAHHPPTHHPLLARAQGRHQPWGRGNGKDKKKVYEVELCAFKLFMAIQYQVKMEELLQWVNIAPIDGYEIIEISYSRLKTGLLGKERLTQCTAG